jgi:hypothetical protein
MFDYIIKNGVLRRNHYKVHKTTIKGLVKLFVVLDYRSTAYLVDKLYSKDTLESIRMALIS